MTARTLKNTLDASRIRKANAAVIMASILHLVVDLSKESTKLSLPENNGRPLWIQLPV